MNFSILIIIFQLIFLEGILSIDNAAVLGAMVIPLPDTEKIPWPKGMKRVGYILDHVLGHQRVAALRVGLIGAYAGRGIMLVLANFIISNPWVKLIGAAYLIRLALDDLSANSLSTDGDDETHPVKVRSFWMTVLSIELMDLAFSLDNVVVAVSLSEKLWVVMIGVAIGILVMRFAAGLFSYVIEKEPILKTAAYILVLNIGVELLLEDLGHIEFGDWTRFGISIGTIALSLAYAHLPFLRFFRPVLVWISQGFGLINGLIGWVLTPFIGTVRWILRSLKRKPNKIENEQLT